LRSSCSRHLRRGHQLRIQGQITIFGIRPFPTMAYLRGALSSYTFSGQTVTWANGKVLSTIGTNGALTEHQAKPTSVQKGLYSPASVAETRASSEVAPNASVPPPHLPVSQRRTECAAGRDEMERYLGRGPLILRGPQRERLVDSCRP